MRRHKATLEFVFLLGASARPQDRPQSATGASQSGLSAGVEPSQTTRPPAEPGEKAKEGRGIFVLFPVFNAAIRPIPTADQEANIHAVCIPSAAFAGN
jgi:hypothetical protein